MARSKEAVATMAATMGLPEGSAVQIDRTLADAGARPALKRGRAADHVDASFLAAFVVGAAASDKVKDAARAANSNHAAVATVQDAIEAEAASPGIARKSNWSLTIELPSAGDLKRRSTISWKTIETAASLLAKEMGK